MASPGVNTHRQSLRYHLGQLQAADALHLVRESVDLEFELAAYLCLLPSNRAVLFDAVRGHSTEVVANLLTSRERIASSLGVVPGGLQRKIVDAIAAPVAPRRVTEAPVQEVVLEAPDLARLPVPTFFAGETGPYITAGAIVAKDPRKPVHRAAQAAGEQPGFHRHRAQSPPRYPAAPRGRKRGDAAHRRDAWPSSRRAARGGALSGTRGRRAARGGRSARRADRSGALPRRRPRGAGPLRDGAGRPIDAGDTIEEGAVSEFHGMFERYGIGQVATFDLLTQRRDAMFQVIQPDATRKAGGRADWTEALPPPDVLERVRRRLDEGS